MSDTHMSFMNDPDGTEYQAILDYDGIHEWIVCPRCMKKQFRITPGAVIRGQIFKCKGSNCKKLYEVNYN